MIAWHYTTGQAAVEIIRSGRLLAKPALWFSTRATVDPSACRTVLRAGRPYRLSAGEMHRLFAGWVRFGVESTALVPCDQVRARRQISRVAWRQWLARVRDDGADPRQWYASFEPIDLERCQVQRLDGHPLDGAWANVVDPRAWASAELDAVISLELCRVGGAEAR